MNYYEALKLLHSRLTEEEKAEQKAHERKVELAFLVATDKDAIVSDLVNGDEEMFSEGSVLSKLHEVSNSDDEFEKEVGTQAVERYWNMLSINMSQPLDESDLGMTL